MEILREKFTDLSTEENPCADDDPGLLSYNVHDGSKIGTKMVLALWVLHKKAQLGLFSIIITPKLNYKLKKSPCFSLGI